MLRTWCITIDEPFFSFCASCFLLSKYQIQEATNIERQINENNFRIHEGLSMCLGSFMWILLPKCDRLNRRFRPLWFLSTKWHFQWMHAEYEGRVEGSKEERNTLKGIDRLYEIPSEHSGLSDMLGCESAKYPLPPHSLIAYIPPRLESSVIVDIIYHIPDPL